MTDETWHGGPISTAEHPHDPRESVPGCPACEAVRIAPAIAKASEEHAPVWDVLLADPPWKYNERRGKQARFGAGAPGHYKGMKPEDIAALPMGAYGAARSMLFLWATWPLLPEALSVMAGWGYRYTTIGFLWVKIEADGSPVHGGGFYSKANTEPCLIGVRGRPMKPAVDTVSSVILSPTREHSRKPEACRTRISLMYPKARKIELFCRESAQGWATWGDEVDEPGFARQSKLFEGAP